MTEFDKPYEETAYRSDSAARLPPPLRRKDANRSGIFDTHLAYGHYADLEPEMEVTVQVEGDEHKVYEKQEERAENLGVYCDSRRWRFQNSSQFQHWIFVLKLLSFPFTWVFWGVGILSALVLGQEFEKYLQDLSLLFFVLLSVVLCLGSLTLHMTGKKIVHHLQIFGFLACSGIVIYKDNTLFKQDALQIALWLGAFLYFMGARGFNGLLWLYSKFGAHDGSEFNRTDGMLRFKRRFRKLFVAPFEEFDPVLQLLPSGYGSHDYAIWLHHRYSENKVCLATKVHSLGLDQANALAFWDCLQRYMDVTQPLPDLPVLEQSRHLDPVTAAHDSRTGRNPRRWRDQDLEDWKANGSKHLRQQLQEHRWQVHPCIIKARIDPTLSIRTYYRAQGAKGIHSTPGAEYFRGIRT